MTLTVSNVLLSCQPKHPTKREHNVHKHDAKDITDDDALVPYRLSPDQACIYNHRAKAKRLPVNTQHRTKLPNKTRNDMKQKLDKHTLYST